MDDPDYGSFCIEMSAADDDFLSRINLDDLIGVDENQPPAQKRFKAVDDSDLDDFEQRRHSKATKKNTAWGIKVFQDWHSEVYGQNLDFDIVSSEELAVILRKFYCEASPKQNDSRKKNYQQTPEEYHRNSLKNIRAAINRYLTDIKRDIDIVRDKAFKAANNTLDGFLKSRMEKGKSVQTRHKLVINDQDLEKITTYFRQPMSPVLLRQQVWYMLSIQFVSRGLEFHHQLQSNSFLFATDEEGEYFTLCHETKEKTKQGGLDHESLQMEKKVYATGSDLCPVKTLKLFLEKTDPMATSLFNHYNKEAQDRPKQHEIWYTSKPLANRTYSNFMGDISVAAKLDNKYTAHCLRATAIQQMNNAGFEARHIMFMSGHKSEASIRSYNRSCSNHQKKKISSMLTSVLEGHPAQTSSNFDEASTSNNQMILARGFDVVPSQQFVQSNHQDVQAQTFFSGAHFTGCTFNFQK